MISWMLDMKWDYAPVIILACALLFFTGWLLDQMYCKDQRDLKRARRKADAPDGVRACEPMLRTLRRGLRDLLKMPCPWDRLAKLYQLALPARVDLAKVLELCHNAQLQPHLERFRGLCWALEPIHMDPMARIRLTPGEPPTRHNMFFTYGEDEKALALWQMVRRQAPRDETALMATESASRMVADAVRAITLELDPLIELLHPSTDDEQVSSGP